MNTIDLLKEHVRELTINIGDRSVGYPDNLERAAKYIENFYCDIDLRVNRRPYSYKDIIVANIVSGLPSNHKNANSYLLGAHYDTVAGTVGADDNASAIAVQLEVARQLCNIGSLLKHHVKFVSFTLEEPPAAFTKHMGSRVYVKNARENKERIDGMICLEMVGYTSPNQKYPFPLQVMGYPREGNFIGIVGDFNSRKFTRSLYRAFQTNDSLPVVKLDVPMRGWALPDVRRSDHSSFWDQGYKAVMITDTSFFRNPNYHLASDTMESLDFNFMAELVRSLVTFFSSDR